MTARSHVALLLTLASIAVPAAAQQTRPGPATGALSQSAMQQISAIETEKRSRTVTQQKIDSNLLYGVHIASGRAAAMGIPSTLQVALPMAADGRVLVDVRADVSPALLAELRALGAEIVDTSAVYRHIGIRTPLAIIESIAAIPEVGSLMPEYGAMTMTGRVSATMTRIVPGQADQRAAFKAAARARVIEQLKNALRQRNAYQDRPVANTGPVDTQGDATHRAAEARTALGVNGSGVTIGVLSDGVCSLSASQSRGELGPVTVLTGQDIPSGGTCGSTAPYNYDEGTAMLEIVHDIAPGAALYFATAFNGITSFASNIAALRSAGCDIIVDDVGYFAESPIQDGQTGTSPTNGGVVTQAVKNVAAGGGLYFSSAANSGRVDFGTSGTWEGDFTGVSVPSGPLAGRVVNSFSGATYDIVTAGSSSGAPTTLFWADPLGASSNDFDLYVLDSTGTSIVGQSTNTQNGTQDPFEIVMTAPATNQRLVIVKFNGSGVFMHLATNRGTLSVATGGETHAHAATSAPYTYGVAATPACGSFGGTPAGPCTSTFVSTNKVESFSSDGFRRIFFNSSGAAFTPGNFSSSGGVAIGKPDITAADGVSTSVPGFTTFFGTSAAAPHAAAIAALVKSANLSLTQSQIHNALVGTAIDIEQPGFDRNSGYGIVMAYQAVQSISTAPVITTNPAASTTVLTGQAIFLSSAASGAPAPLPQWQVSVNGGASWTNVAGATGPNISFAAERLDNGKWYRCVYTNSAGSAVTAAAKLYVRLRVRTDLDNDGKSDLLLWRPSGSLAGYWFWLYSASNYPVSSSGSKQWGNNSYGDVPLSGDMDGDGKADLVVWRASSGTWLWLTSSTGYDYAQGHQVQWGNQSLGDVPLLGDIDGDGKADLIVWRASTGTWYWLLSSTGYNPSYSGAKQWGNSNLGDRPMIGDLDGDGLADLVVWRSSDGNWFWLTSSSGYNTAMSGQKQWGNNGLGDIPLLADMDGDGVQDLVVWRASNGTWYWLTAITGYDYAHASAYQWGNSSLGDVPMLGDIDGDGLADLIVWRSSDGTWYWLVSGTGYSLAGQGQKQWGTAGDIPMIK